ncbi:glycosyltransferase family 8 protein [Daldinia caldariorum]|uniref:glycosyltransferase family 8 protein n=1 Tax=Daldinia caldariorum TaxID=326644 RepID=UPI002007604E|nr:glycosyltransferase family 8 protein [Daldinia caldariorum]KAI1468669.1 glycosyltransferase family 8 protein [Daldinia caldariorum]
MSAQDGPQEDVYATLLLSDTYLPGALVLAQSLRDAGTTKKLAALVTRDTVAPEVITELETVYDYIIPVNTIRNTQTANLNLMGRADLHSAFTKINLWQQTQFRKIVYIDADVVAYRAPDELFDLPHPFSAAPDIGWPDLFNTGVMALTPNLSDYQAMLAMAERSISFDGADQGLINLHFKDYNRLSFAYNVTPSAHYQYVPAYRHFQSGINLVHFIGPDKPWFQGRSSTTGSAPFNEMTGKWWAVYDRHYSGSDKTSELVQFFTKGEFQSHGTTKNTYILKHGQNGYSSSSSSWDASRHAPPTNSRPEAQNLPTTVYHMSQDTTQWVAPKWYVPPREPGAPPMKQIFPWETERSAPTRVFAEDYPQEPEEEPEEEVEEEEEEEEEEPLSSGAQTPTGGAWNAPSVTDASTDDQRSELVTPTTPTMHAIPNTWNSFTMTNAWDDVPEIERYVDKIQRHKQKPSLKSLPGVVGLQHSAEQPEATQRRRGSKVTDFPTEAERPSLPVTPAPVRRTFWDSGDNVHGGNDSNPQLPAAQGVPAQSEWDPAAKLQELSQWHDALLQKLSGDGKGSGEFPHDHIAQSATLVSPKPVKGGANPNAIHSLESNLETLPRIITTGNRKSRGVTPMLAPSYSGPGAAFEKGEGIPTEDMPIPRGAISQHPAAVRHSGVLQPSYSGPGPAFEKDANLPFELSAGQ